MCKCSVNAEMCCEAPQNATLSKAVCTWQTVRMPSTSEVSGAFQGLKCINQISAHFIELAVTLFSTVFPDFKINREKNNFFYCLNNPTIQNIFSVLITYLKSRCIHVDCHVWMYPLHFIIFNHKREKNMPLFNTIWSILNFTLFL